LILRHKIFTIYQSPEILFHVPQIYDYVILHIPDPVMVYGITEW